MCLKGGPRGGGTRYYGRKGCQAWTIKASNPVPALRWKRDVEEEGVEEDEDEEVARSRELYWKLEREAEAEAAEQETTAAKLRRGVSRLMGRGDNGYVAGERRGVHDGDHVHEP